MENSITKQGVYNVIERLRTTRDRVGMEDPGDTTLIEHIESRINALYDLYLDGWFDEEE